MKKYKNFINENIRDKMTPVSEEDIKKKMGEEKYNIYRKYTDAMNNLKPPFVISINNRFDMFDGDDGGNILNFRFWFIRFELFYANDVWNYLSRYNEKENNKQFKNWNEVYEQMKKDIRESFNEEIKYAKKEIKRYEDNIKDMNKDFEKLQ